MREGSKDSNDMYCKWSSADKDDLTKLITK